MLKMINFVFLNSALMVSSSMWICRFRFTSDSSTTFSLRSLSFLYITLTNAGFTNVCDKHLWLHIYSMQSLIKEGLLIIKQRIFDRFL